MSNNYCTKLVLNNYCTKSLQKHRELIFWQQNNNCNTANFRAKFSHMNKLCTLYQWVASCESNISHLTHEISVSELQMYKCKKAQSNWYSDIKTTTVVLQIFKRSLAVRTNQVRNTNWPTFHPYPPGAVKNLPHLGEHPTWFGHSVYTMQGQRVRGSRLRPGLSHHAAQRKYFNRLGVSRESVVDQ